MKAIDFMVGDWVLINGAPRKIQAVDGFDNEIMADDELYTLAEDRYHSEDKVEGVSITQEILKKNGFKTLEFYSELLYNDWQIMCDCSAVAARNARGWGIDIPCRYVHELQHVLRLCGIDKEIVL